MHFTFVAAILWMACDAADDAPRTLEPLTERVAHVAPGDSIAHQVPENQRQRLQHANQDSSAAWKRIQSLAEWKSFRQEKIDALRTSLGVSPDRTTLRQRVTSTVAGEGFAIDNLLFESRPGWWVSANLYRPDPPRTSMPGIVICHAHHTPKEHGELQDMGMTWARAGCYVLVPDQLGHGERRQHPFAKANDFSKSYRVGPADYYFRYDSSIQLQLVGESLIGWMAWDLMRCADVLLERPGIDRQRLILLGAVAGGGDPAAVTGALDERFAAVVPFNFGGPQPETRYPLPDDIEASFHYAGSGGWESTRNLRSSADGGFLPWVIVGAIAPRRLIYAHEFNWDRDRDPVWKRLVAIYDLHGAPGNLAFTHGYGELRGQPPEASHCTHIGPPHRVRIHEAFRQWFQIEVSRDSEYSSRLPTERLRCWTADQVTELQPRRLVHMTQAIADQQFAELRNRTPGGPQAQRRAELRERWRTVLGAKEPMKPVSSQTVHEQSMGDIRFRGVLLDTADGVKIPCALFQASGASPKTVVIGICSQGKERLWKERIQDLEALLRHTGVAVCLIDPRGLGESQLGRDHGRRSAATAYASTELMLGSTLLGQQLKDVRTVMTWIRNEPGLGGCRFAVWGESFAPANPPSAEFRQPRDDDGALPRPSEPQAPLLALLAGLFEDDVTAIYAAGGLASWRLLLADYLVLLAYDALVPGATRSGDIRELVELQRDTTRVRLEACVDGWNRLVPNDQLPGLLDFESPDRGPPNQWASAERSPTIHRYLTGD